MSPALADRILLTALDAAPHAGWSMPALRQAAEAEGRDGQMADALFGDLTGATQGISDYFDRRMMEQLDAIDAGPMKVRLRIATAVRTRLDLMAPHRAGLRVTLARYARPLSGLRAAKPVWRSADRIWAWAGDTATDYNRYTKRALLSGVMGSTLLYWLQDNSPNMIATSAFLDRRIDQVLKLGQSMGKLLARKAA